MRRFGQTNSSRAFLATVILGACGLLGAWVALAAEPRTTSLISTGPASTDGQGEPYFGDISADGSRVFFETDERLVAADTDSQEDAYERADGETRLLSIGPDGGNGSAGSFAPHASADGNVVYFESRESLLAADDDAEVDIYRREGDVLTLVSTGSAGNGAQHVELNHVSEDGSRVYFGTEDALVPADEDVFWDVYVHEAGVTSLASPGVELAAIELDGVTDDGSVLFFRTAESLAGGDTDGFYDVYSRSGGSYELHSLGPDGGNDPSEFAVLQGFSEDGSRVFFSTEESLVAADTDEKGDIYESSAGVVSLVSAGGNGPHHAQFGGSSADGGRVFISTNDQLVAADVNNAYDVYERSGGVTTLVSSGAVGSSVSSVKALSADGDRVLVESDYPLVEADADSSADVYEFSGGTVTLLSEGAEGDDAYFLAASDDLNRVFFETAAAADPADTDSAGTDVYEARGGEVAVRSVGPGGGGSADTADFDAISPDGLHLAFHTPEALLAADLDEDVDLYLAGPPGPEPGPTPEPAGDFGQSPPPAVSPIGAKPRCAGKPATIVGSGKRDVLKGHRQARCDRRSRRQRQDPRPRRQRPDLRRRRQGCGQGRGRQRQGSRAGRTGPDLRAGRQGLRQRRRWTRYLPRRWWPGSGAAMRALTTPLRR